MRFLRDRRSTRSMNWHGLHRSAHGSSAAFRRMTWRSSGLLQLTSAWINASGPSVFSRMRQPVIGKSFSRLSEEMDGRFEPAALAIEYGLCGS